MVVLGISAFYHDASAALVRDGVIVAAAQEERFSRVKGDQAFPAAAVRFCLERAGVGRGRGGGGAGGGDRVVYYDKPLLTFDRLLESHLALVPRGFESFVHSVPVWVKRKLHLKPLLVRELNALDRGTVDPGRILFNFHHHSHAASAFYPSPFPSAAILVMDGVGEWATTSLGRGEGNSLELLREIRFPHSLGLLYSAFTYHLGFRVNEGEYKVMGLAPYGEPRHAATIREHLLDLKEDGSFRMNLEFFNFVTGMTMTNHRFDQLFGGRSPRRGGEPLERFHMDMAASVQQVVEEAVLRLGRTVHRLTGEERLCMAGGVALNCVANGRLLREGPFRELWIQPASGDAGGALGAALAWSCQGPGGQRPLTPPGEPDGMAGACLGPEYADDEVCRVLDRLGAVHHRLEEGELYPAVAGALAREQVVGWFQGRMEFGPRALGNRSILGDPRSPRMQRLLNLKIKYRESFRPFAPAVLAERAGEYFDLDRPSPYMLLVCPVRPERRLGVEAVAGDDLMGRLHQLRSDIPAVTHVDHSARVQTVHPATNPRFHRLLLKFEELTGCPVLVNTSFNVRDEPIVCTPEDAYRCFMGTEMDWLVVNNRVLRKEEQR